MGPQPISPQTLIAPPMLEAAKRVMALVASGDRAGLAAIAAPSGANELATVAAAARSGVYDRSEIVATARINNHHYVKARLHGPLGDAFTMQFRLGEYEGEWRVWDAMNLTGRHGASAR
jgi:hypothetical protein